MGLREIGQGDQPQKAADKRYGGSVATQTLGPLSTCLASIFPMKSLQPFLNSRAKSYGAIANALETRSAGLLPHFKNRTFVIRIASGALLVGKLSSVLVVLHFNNYALQFRIFATREAF